VICNQPANGLRYLRVGGHELCLKAGKTKGTPREMLQIGAREASYTSGAHCFAVILYKGAYFQGFASSGFNFSNSTWNSGLENNM